MVLALKIRLGLLISSRLLVIVRSVLKVVWVGLEGLTANRVSYAVFELTWQISVLVFLVKIVLGAVVMVSLTVPLLMLFMRAAIRASAALIRWQICVLPVLGVLIMMTLFETVRSVLKPVLVSVFLIELIVPYVLFMCRKTCIRF